VKTQRTGIKISKFLFLLLAIFILVGLVVLIDESQSRYQAARNQKQQVQTINSPEASSSPSPSDLSLTYDVARNLYILGFHLWGPGQNGPTETMEIFDSSWSDQQAEDELCSIVNSGKHNIISILTHRRLKDEGPSKWRGQLFDSTVFYKDYPGPGNQLRMMIFDAEGYVDLSKQDRFDRITQDAIAFCADSRYEVLRSQDVRGISGRLHSMVIYYKER